MLKSQWSEMLFSFVLTNAHIHHSSTHVCKHVTTVTNSPTKPNLPTTIAFPCFPACQLKRSHLLLMLRSGLVSCYILQARLYLVDYFEHLHL